MPRGYERSLPTWSVVTVKIIVALTLFTSIAYLAACSWGIADVVQGRKKSDSREVVDLTCFSISIISTFVQTITSLGLLFNCHGDIKRHSYRWIIIQTILLVIIVLAYFIPFSFNHEGQHEEISNFADKTASHLGAIAENVREGNADHPSHVVPYTFLLNSISVLVGCVVVGAVVAVGAKSGYQAVN